MLESESFRAGLWCIERLKLRPLLLIGQKLHLEGLVLLPGSSARSRPGQRTIDDAAGANLVNGVKWNGDRRAVAYAASAAESSAAAPTIAYAGEAARWALRSAAVMQPPAARTASTIAAPTRPS